jgi:ATP-dependent DNA ligase
MLIVARQLPAALRASFQFEQLRSEQLMRRTAVIKSGLPAFIRPQLSKLVEVPPSGDNWVHEIKFDG